MKVCFIAGTLGRGGAERQLLYMLRALQSEGVESRVLCLTRNEAFEGPISSLGIDVDWVGRSGSRPLRLAKIIRDLKKRPADIVQSVHFFTNIYAGTAGRVLRINSIGAIRSDLAFEMQTNDFYGKWQLRLPRHLISNSAISQQRALMYGISPTKIDFLRNVVDPEAPNGNTPRTRDTLTILFAGRLTSEKRPELFVKLAARLKDQQTETRLRFVVAGDGPLLAELKEAANSLGLSGDDLSFLGQLDDMAEIYRQTEILVLTSAHEGTPNVVLEAMSFGIPVVATDVGGVKEVLNGERGFLVGSSDLDGLSECVSKLIRDPGLRDRLGHNGKSYVASEHSIDYLRQGLMAIYTKLLR